MNLWKNKYEYHINITTIKLREVQLAVPVPVGTLQKGAQY